GRPRRVGPLGAGPAPQLLEPRRSGRGHRRRRHRPAGHPHDRRRGPPRGPGGSPADDRASGRRRRPMTATDAGSAASDPTRPDLADPPMVSGGVDGDHLDELRADPIALMGRLRDECGDIGRFNLAGRDVVLLSGADANEFFFRAPEELMDQAEAYPFMTPIFGEGVVFDAPPERRREMLHNQALRDKFMRGNAATIAGEVDAMVAGWEDHGDIDLLE